jgi:hypothetical protein
MHYLSLIYFVNQPLHVSGMFIAHHQEVFTVYVQQLVRVMCYHQGAFLTPSEKCSIEEQSIEYFGWAWCV